MLHRGYSGCRIVTIFTCMSITTSEIDMKRLIFLILFIALSTSSYAGDVEIYTDDKGMTHFVGTPASEEKEEEQKKTQQRLEGIEKLKRSSGEELAKQEAEKAEKARKGLLERTASAGKLAVGMSKKQVRKAWGKPTKINKGGGSGKVQEEWRYPGYNYRTMCLYFENDKLTSWHTKKPRQK